MPFDSFGGYIDMPDGSRCSVLKLVIEAVEATQDFSIFASRTTELMVEYKWGHFGRYAFFQALLFYVMHVLVVTYYNTRAAASMDVPALTVWGYDRPDGVIVEPDWRLVGGWLWTTAIALWMLKEELQQAATLNSAGEYFGDWINLLDQACIWTQLAANILFWFRTNSVIGLSGQATEKIVDDLKVPLEPLGILLSLHALSVTFHFLRSLGYFRGFLQLGALVHTVIEVTRDIRPFCVLVLVIWLGFAFTMRILLYHTPYGAASAADITIDGGNDYGFATLGDSIFASAEAGFYANYNAQPMKAAPIITCGWFLFMFYTQIVLLNLLIAIMSDTHSRVHEVARHVAMFERAKLIIEFEKALGFDQFRAEGEEPMSPTRSASAARAYQRHRTRDKLGDQMARAAERGATAWRATDPCSRMGKALREWGPSWATYLTPEQTVPRWLHVLDPDESEAPESDLVPVEIELAELRREMRDLASASAESMQKMMGLVGAQAEPEPDV